VEYYLQHESTSKEALLTRIENQNKYMLKSLKVIPTRGGANIVNLSGNSVNFMGSSNIVTKYCTSYFIMLFGGWLNIYCPDVY
jgi:hypothetical protein